MACRPTVRADVEAEVDSSNGDGNQQLTSAMGPSIPLTTADSVCKLFRPSTTEQVEKIHVHSMY